VSISAAFELASPEGAFNSAVWGGGWFFFPPKRKNFFFPFFPAGASPPLTSNARLLAHWFQRPFRQRHYSPPFPRTPKPLDRAYETPPLLTAVSTSHGKFFWTLALGKNPAPGLPPFPSPPFSSPFFFLVIECVSFPFSPFAQALRIWASGPNLFIQSCRAGVMCGERRDSSRSLPFLCYLLFCGCRFKPEVDRFPRSFPAFYCFPFLFVLPLWLTRWKRPYATRFSRLLPALAPPLKVIFVMREQSVNIVLDLGRCPFPVLSFPLCFKVMTNTIISST